MSFRVCDGSGEDPHCSDGQRVDLSVYDHLHYLGYFEDCVDYYDETHARFDPSLRLN